VIGLYLHVPYCTVRCSYCDFYLVPARGRDLGAFAAALRAEIEETGAAHRGAAADTLHCGGGTPSVLPPALLAGVIEAARRVFALGPGAEIAIEANPEDIDAARAAAWRERGVGRIAIGVQSFDDARLRLMRRPHDAERAAEAITTARAAGFASVAVDLILALPGPGPDRTRDDVDRAVDLGADHVSLYLLEVHERTRLGRAVALGRVAPPSPDAAAGTWEDAAERLEAHGFEHYEISNFARPGHRSRHNMKYWTDADYLGFGPSAHSYCGGRRWANAADLAGYLRSGGRGVARRFDDAPKAQRAFEALIAGLRIAEGVDLERLRARYGPVVPGADDPVIGVLAGAGLVVLTGARLALTRRGRLVSNEVFERLMPAPGVS
jgi:putative oxygen-independent coproporphyrinogen III oxidase